MIDIMMQRDCACEAVDCSFPDYMVDQTSVVVSSIVGSALPRRDPAGALPGSPPPPPPAASGRGQRRHEWLARRDYFEKSYRPNAFQTRKHCADAGTFNPGRNKSEADKKKA